MGKKTQAGKKEMEWRISDWRDHPDLTADEMMIRWNCSREAAKKMISRKEQYFAKSITDLDERIAEIAHLKMVVENQKSKLREFALLLEEKEKRIDSLKERLELLEKLKPEEDCECKKQFEAEHEARLKAEERLSKALKKIGEFYMNKENEG